MDDENLAREQAPDDLDWTPPELTQRALYTAQKDAGNFQGKKKRLDLKKQPPGNNRTLSLALLLGGALFLVVGTIVAATGANGQQAVLEKGRLWYALWMSGQAAMLCVFLLFLLPLEKDMRRPALFTVMGAGLAFSAVGEWIGSMHITTAGILAVSLLLALAFTSEVWLLLGLARRKTTERLACVMGSVNLFIGLVTLLGNLANPNMADAPIYITVLRLLQGGCFVALLFTWPVLERPVLERPVLAAPPKSDLNDGYPPPPPAQRGLLVPPAGKRQGLALAMLCVMALTALVSAARPFVTGPGLTNSVLSDPLYIGLTALNLLLTLLVYLKFVLPGWKPHRKTLGWLLGASLACTLVLTVYGVLQGIRLGSMVNSMIGGILGVAMSPFLYLFVGACNKKSMEKIAGIFAVVSLGIPLLSILALLLTSRLAESIELLGFLLTLLFPLVGAVCSFVLYFTWPVLERPVLERPAAAPAKTMDEGEMNDG